MRVRSLVTGLAQEAFLDEYGVFAQVVELQPEIDNPLEFTVCDGSGRELARVVAAVRHPSRDRYSSFKLRLSPLSVQGLRPTTMPAVLRSP